jgi:hypothetical protein
VPLQAGLELIEPIVGEPHLHIRDDLGGIHNMLAITNGLLAGIITALTLGH